MALKGILLALIIVISTSVTIPPPTITA